MNELEKYEELFKQKLDSVDFPFDEGNWNKAEQAIDESRKKQRKPFILLFSIVGAFVLTLATFLFFNNNSKSNDSTKQVLADVKEANNIIYESNINTEEKTLHIKGEGSLIEKSYRKNEIAKDNKRSNTGDKEQGSSLKLKGNKEANSKLIGHQRQNNSNKLKINGLVKKISIVNNIAIYNNDQVGQQAEGTETHATKTIGEKKQSENADKNIINESHGYNNSNSKIIDSLSLLKTLIDNEMTNRSAEDSAVKYLNVNVINGVKNVDSLKQDSLSVLKIEKQDSINLLKNLTQNEKDEISVPMKGTLSVEAGMDYLLGWKNNDKIEGFGINPIIGFTYSRYMNPKFGFLFGLHYNTVSNLSSLTYSVSNPKYDFGIEQVITDVSYKKIQYFSLPLKLVYKPTMNNVFGLGINAGYLANIRANVSTYQISDLDSITKVNFKEEQQNLKNNTFNKFDFRATIFYRRRVYKKLNAGLEAMYGLSDIKRNSVFKTEYFEKNVGLRFTVIYDLF